MMRHAPEINRRTNRARRRRALPWALLVAISLLGLAATPASAQKTHLFKEVFGSAQQPDPTNPVAITVDRSNGDVYVVEAGSQPRFSRYHADGTAAPFSALGTNGIDGARGPGGLPCAEEAASCDETPENGFRSGGLSSLGGAGEVQLAVDESGGVADGNLYLSQKNGNVVGIFAADGHYLGQLTRAGTKVLGEPSGVAVDPAGNIYLSESGRKQVDKFTPTANPPVNTDFVKSFSTGASSNPPESIALGVGATAGKIFVARLAGSAPVAAGAVLRFDLAAGTLDYAVTDGLLSKEGFAEGLGQIAIDPTSGHLFVAGGKRTGLDEFDVSGGSAATLVSTNYMESQGGVLIQPGAVNVDTGGNIYATGTQAGFLSSSSQKIKVYEPAVVTQPDRTSATAATDFTPTKATLSGVVNADGQPLTSCVFEYGPVVVNSDGTLSVLFEDAVPCVGPLPADASPHSITARVTGLLPSTKYGFRISVENANGQPVFGTHKQFETPKIALFNPFNPYTLITSNSAIANAEVNPDGGLVSACEFEYQTEANFLAHRANEVQTITLNGATGGSFRPGFESLQTAPLPFDATAAAVQSALRALPPLDGSVLVSGASGGPYTVEFFLDQADREVEELTADGSSLTPGGAAVAVATIVQGNEGWEGAESASCAESAAEIGEGEDLVPVHAELPGLQQQTKYASRFVTSTVAGSDKTSGVVFTTLSGFTVTTGVAGSVTTGSATLSGALNPNGSEFTGCSFQLVAVADYEPLAGNPYAGGRSVPCAESPGEIGSGSADVPVHADVTGLEAGTAYRFRLTATHPLGTGSGEAAFFTAAGPLVEDQWAQRVGNTEAQLQAEINPRGAATTYRVEYGEGNAGPYEETVAGSAPVGSDDSAHLVGVLLEGLEPGTDYHYRFVATSNCVNTEPSLECVSAGPDLHFRTVSPALPRRTDCANQDQRAFSSAALPNCRAYEMVSPVDKGGADVKSVICLCSDREARLVQASPDGEKITYSSYRSFGDPEGAHSVSQYLASRQAGVAWGNQNLNPPQEGRDRLDGLSSPYKAFSEDLCQAWVLKGTEPLLAPGAVPGYTNLYRRDLCGGGYEALTTVEPYQTEPQTSGVFYIPRIEGSSADHSRSFFTAAGGLTEVAATNAYQLYGAASGEIFSVCFLPDGAPYGKQCELGSSSVQAGVYNLDGSVDGAVSEDGSRVYWSDKDRALYLRERPERDQSAVAGGECTEPEKACTLKVSPGAEAFFWTATPDGSKALYSGKAPGITGEVRVALGEGNTQLYLFDAETGVSTLIAGRAYAPMGASEDLSRIYLSSREVLAGPNGRGASPREGQPNLYLYEDGSFRFVATLSPEDLNANSGTGRVGPIAMQPFFRGSRVNGDGLHAVFTSKARLTGYDNTDRISGEADTEVFLYEAASDTLRCVSCDPTGARPEGAEVILPHGEPSGSWSAAQIPGWEYDQHASRVLSADGRRVFFDALAPLVPWDTNGARDVYQWEAGDSEAACEALGAEVFSPREGGCLSLISSGEAASDSYFLDASADGGDVFILTPSSLVPQDPGLLDVYDAREGGGLPFPLTPSPTCEGEACQSPPSPPNDPTPASETFQGAGNAQEGTPRKPRPCARGKVKRGGKCVNKKSKKQNGKKNKSRAKHERRAGR